MPVLKELMLRSPRLTLAVAESLTCGQVQAAVGRISGASEFFLGGITAYTLEQKVRHLGVDRARAQAVNCVSAGMAEQMARGVCVLFGSDLGVATTGYAEPSPDDDVDVPFAWWAIAHRKADGTEHMLNGRIECPEATRDEVQRQVAAAVMEALVRYLWTVRGGAR
ncbi:MAG: CinA family protein [Opitutaceae bacterium]|nr:CinA family protein [Opitutaceae bacterium]MBP9912236.1 CinA family protein [Opitutaceae bacterium]